MTRTRKYILITISIIGIIIIFTFLSLSLKKPDQTATGGSGVPELGFLVLTGYETSSNGSSKIPLGKFLSSTQQKNIRLFLGALLYEKVQLEEFKGVIVPGSINVDYKKNIIEFKVKIDKPETLYRVTYNTLNDDMKVYDENDKSVQPTFNPDGTTFHSFKSSSQLAQ